MATPQTPEGWEEARRAATRSWPSVPPSGQAAAAYSELSRKLSGRDYMRRDEERLEASQRSWMSAERFKIAEALQELDAVVSRWFGLWRLLSRAGGERDVELRAELRALGLSAVEIEMGLDGLGPFGHLLLADLGKTIR